MFFPQRHPIADAHGLGEQLRLLFGKALVSTNIKVRVDTRPGEFRNGTVHGDHRNVGILVQREVFGRCTRGHDEHWPLLNVAALIQVVHPKRPGDECRFFVDNIHRQCPYPC
ncbi:hypothetical protein D9M73_261920 [compost metagenome]